MQHRLATVATYWSPIEANLAKNALASAGIRGFLADEQAASMMWHMTNALRGIKLQVEDRDAEEADAILADFAMPAPPVCEEVDNPSTAICEETRAAEWDEPEKDDPQSELTPRERNAERALRASFLGLIFLPLQVLALGLLLNVFTSPERLAPSKRWQAIAAVFVSLPAAFICLWILKTGFLHRDQPKSYLWLDEYKTMFNFSPGPFLIP